MLNGQLEQSAMTNIATASPNETLFAVKPNEVEMKLPLQDRYCNLSTEDKKKADKVNQDIECFYDQIPTVLRGWPEIQRQCLNDLREAETILCHCPLQQKDIVEGRFAVTKVRNAFEEVKERDSVGASLITLFISIATVIAMGFILNSLVGLVNSHDLRAADAAKLNQELFLGVPLPVWGWSIIGNFTSILLRADQLSVLDLPQVARWFILRIIAGTVMGVLTYLMVVTGLIIFAGNTKTSAPELIWVIAFVGSFSDTLSINLLQKILGQFSPVENSNQVKDKKPIDGPSS